MPDLKSIRTAVLEIAYADDGPRDGRVVMLLHGWPDAPRGWNQVAQILHSEGFRTIVPYLRGLPPTRFLSSTTPRVGGAVALAQDAIVLADALGLDRFAVVGHDWGARAARLNLSTARSWNISADANSVLLRLCLRY